MTAQDLQEWLPVIFLVAGILLAYGFAVSFWGDDD